ncbi:MAG: sortase [Anaerolineae bacterium]|nr:sortase [Anaerolineae bacterium]
MVTFTIPQLDVGETVTLSITGTVQSNLPAGTQITNRATLAFTEAPGTTRESNTVIASVMSGATTSGLSKSVSLPSAAPGQNLTYTLQYTNTTGQTVTNVVVTDLFNSFLSINSASVTPPDRGTFNIDLNSRTVTFTLPIVNVNETITMTVNTLISTSIPPGITISNVASFTSALQPTAMQSNTVSTIVSGAAVATSTPIGALPPGSTGPPGAGGAEPPFGTGGPSELPETGGRPRPAGQGIDEPAATNRLLFLVMTILSLVPALALVAFGVRRTRPRVGVIRWRLILVGMVVATLLLGVLAATTTLSVEPLLLAVGLLTLAVMLMGLAMVWRNRAFQERDRVLAAVLSTMTVTALVASTLLIPYYNMPAVEVASAVDDGQAEGPAVAAGATETADEAGALSADMWDVSKYADQFPAEPEVIHRIAIPALNVNRAVVEAAIDGKSWNITTFDREVAHLEGTSYPGITGNVVLAGHITLASGGFGPFKDLNRLVPGDVVVLYGPERQYVYQIEAVDVLGRKDIEAAYPTDEPTLTLITCTNWSPREWAYLQRLVVRARLMPERSATYY